MTERPYRICLIEDDEIMGEALVDRFALEGLQCDWFRQGRPALETLARKRYDAVVSDIQLPDVNGEALFEEARTGGELPPWIFITGYGAIDDAVRMLKLGAEDYLTKPLDIRALLDKLRAVCARGRPAVAGEPTLGVSSAMRAIEAMLPKIANSTGTVLITGESGVGKEEVARALHRARDHEGARPFVAVNCGALTETLLEAELFGHVKGSFTGAIAHKPGKVESADSGTLFLDEIGEMSFELQVKLLRLIQSGEIEKVGASTPSKVDVRIIAATHRNLRTMIEDGAFREDLYYRLAVIPLELPPLRERLDDIPELVQHFFVKAKEKVRRPDVALPAALVSYFQRYTWPGNIRELENIIERLVVLCRGTEIVLEDLPDYLRRESSAADALRLDLHPDGISLEAVEKDLILRALEKFSWNQTHAARYLDISRKTLMYRMEKHGIRRAEDSQKALVPPPEG